MKKLIFLLIAGLVSTLRASASDGNEGDFTKGMLKQELEHHLKFPSGNSSRTYDEVYIELAVKADGSVEVKNMNAASQEVRNSVEEQISRMKLNIPAGKEATYVFKLCFRSA